MMKRLAACGLLAVTTARGFKFELSFDEAALSLSKASWSGLSTEPTLTGRVRLYMAKNNASLPFEADSDGASTAQVFGVDAVNMSPRNTVTLDSSVFGYPRTSLEDIEDGEYYVQGELFLYDKWERPGMPVAWMPAACVSAGGENGQYAKPEGTLYSAVEKISFAASEDTTRSLLLEHVVPKAKSPGCAGLGDGVDSAYVKTMRIQSDLLSKFWGRPMRLEACILLPGGFEDRPNASYPLVVAHGHYSPKFNPGGAFSEEWPDCDPDTEGYSCVSNQYAWYLYSNWTAPSGTFAGSRMIVATINHPVPLFDDSYAVNSETLGPWGDAITYELIPAIEKRYRGIGAGWARGLFGGSTGGWESIGVQVLYPDDYNSAFAACPDPVTFTSYASLNIYDESNAYFYDSDFKRTERPGERDEYSGTTWPGYGHPYGQTTATVKEMNHHELALGTRSRSCGQWDIWEAVFGPVCEDGFPCRLYDKLTGAVNRTVADFWREHFDLAHIMKRDWATLGPKLRGKLHIFVGASDTFFLTDAVMDMENFLSSTSDPASDAEIVVGEHKGRGFEHCFRGYEYDADGEPLPNSITRLTYTQAFLPRMARHFAATAPEGADVTSWRY